MRRHKTFDWKVYVFFYGLARKTRLKPERFYKVLNQSLASTPTTVGKLSFVPALAIAPKSPL